MGEILMFVAGALAMLLGLMCYVRGGKRSHGHVFVQAWKPLTQEEIGRVMKGWAQDDPRWRATWDWLNGEYRDVQLELLRPGADVNEQLVWKGRAQMLMVLREQLLAWRKQG